MPSNTNPYFYYKTIEFSEMKNDYSSISITSKFSSNSILQGAGYILSDNVPEISDRLLFSTYLFYIWPKPDGTFHIFTTLCPELDASCNVNSQLVNGVYPIPSDLEWHTITLKYIDSHYEIILDNTCGSGSFLVSAVLEGRKFIGIEKNEEVYLHKKQKVDYIEICKERIKEAERIYKATSSKLF